MLKWILALIFAGACAQAAVYSTGNTSGDKEEVCPLLDSSTIFSGGQKRKVLTRTAAVGTDDRGQATGQTRGKGNEQQ